MTDVERDEIRNLYECYESHMVELNEKMPPMGKTAPSSMMVTNCPEQIQIWASSKILSRPAMTPTLRRQLFEKRFREFSTSDPSAQEKAR